MTDCKKYISRVLSRGYLMSLASIDDNGPWVSDLIYIEDDVFTLYFISRTEFRHSVAFLTHPEAACSITAAEKPEGNSTGVQMSGYVQPVLTVPAEINRRYAKKRGQKSAWIPADGESWYMFTPRLIDLIYEPVFGFTKKTIRLT